MTGNCSHLLVNPNSFFYHTSQQQLKSGYPKPVQQQAPSSDPLKNSLAAPTSPHQLHICYLCSCLLVICSHQSELAWGGWSLYTTCFLGHNFIQNALMAILGDSI